MTETQDLLISTIEHYLQKAVISFGLLKGYLQGGARTAHPQQNANSKDSYALTTPTEQPMKIQLDGVSVNNKPRADGRFQGYVLNDGKRQYFYGRTYESVVEKIKKFLQGGKTQQSKLKDKKRNSPTFGEFLEKWLEIYKKPNLKIKSIESVKSVLKPANTVFENKPINSITSDDVQKLLISINATRVRSLCLMHLNALFNKARIKGLIKVNPCEAVEIKRHKSKHVKALTPEETQIVIDLAAGSSYSLLYRFLVATGLRISEALALSRSDVDFDKYTVTISKNVVFIKGKRIEQDTPKSDAGNRTVPITENLCNELNAIKTELLFPFTYNAVHCALQRIDRKVNFHVTLHVLRHTYATRLEEAGIPPKVKQYLLGHASLEMTQNTYTDIQAQYLETLSDSIRNLFES